MDSGLITNRNMNGRMNGRVENYVILSGCVTELCRIDKMHQKSHRFYGLDVVLVEKYIDLTRFDVLSAVLMKIHAFRGYDVKPIGK